jgi:hypothetical protein
MMSLGEFLGSGSGITKGLWHLNGNSNDSSGNGNNGTDTSMSYSLTNGRFGQGGGFNGTSSRISIPAGGRLTGLSAYTILAWFKTASAAATQHIWSEANSAGTPELSRLVVSVTTGILSYICRDTASNTASIATSGSMADGKWHLATGVKAAANSRLFYVDGALIGTNSTNLGATAINTSFIGALQNGGSTSLWWNGSLDEIIAENVAWSAEKIRKYYTWALGRQISVMG